MLKLVQFPVSAIVLVCSMALLAGCGQKGPLFLPTGPAAAQRATLPQTLTPGAATAPSSAAPAAPAASAPSPATR